MRQATTLLTLILLVLSPCPRGAVAGQAEDDPDRLYERREDLASALAAAGTWARRTP